MGCAVRRALRDERPLPDLEELTPGEIQVLASIAEGRTDRGIAKELYVDAAENRRVHAVLTYLRARTP